MTDEKRGGAGFQIYRPFFLTIFGHRFGFEYSRVGVGPTPYLDRYILYIGGPTLRLHKFWRGDDDRAPHDHPWTFWTFPFTSYYETVDTTEPVHLCGVPIYFRGANLVRAWRFHKRPAKYRHIVEGRADRSGKPFWTFVVTGPVENAWGFWPKPDQFVPWREWT